MFLYHLKTSKLNLLPTILICLMPLLLFLFPFGLTLGFNPELIIFYIASIILSFTLFSYKYSIPKSLSIAVLLTFFASLYWEIPYHIYTIFLRGYLDQAFSLTILPIFFLIFLYQKIHLKSDKINLSLIMLSMIVSSIGMFYLLSLHADIFWVYYNPPLLQQLCEGIWFLSRTVSFISLYIIFYRGVER